MSGNDIVFKAEYSQGDEGGLMDFFIRVQNGAIGAEVSFKAERPNPGGAPIQIPRTKLPAPSILVGMQTTVLAGYESLIVGNYFPNGTPISPGLNLNFSVLFVVSGEARAGAADTPQVIRPVRG
jgi:hypothetical protein